MICILATLLFSIPAFADTYTGVVSGLKHYPQGGVAVFLDGRYPRQKMMLYVPSEYRAAVGPLPSRDAKVTATGTTIQYQGKPEIKIFQASQWKW